MLRLSYLSIIKENKSKLLGSVTNRLATSKYKTFMDVLDEIQREHNNTKVPQF